MKYLYALSFFLLPFFAIAQCPNSTIVLSSQADVDNFVTNYPGCTDLLNAEFLTNLRISGADIVDLSPLSVINSVSGLEIINNPMLISLNGLTITEIWDSGNFSMVIGNNENLTDISALNSAVFLNFIGTSPDGYVTIGSNPQLTTLNGLNGLTVSHDFVITNNDALINLEGLENLQQVGEFFSISNNDQLTNFEGLISLSLGKFLLVSNPLLSDFQGLNNMISGEMRLYQQSIDNFGGLDSFTGDFSIEDCPAIQNLNGFQPVSISGLVLKDNVSLTNISALDNTQIGNPEPTQPWDIFLDISGNQNLSICNNFAICNVLELYANDTENIFNYVNIYNNADGCNNEAQVAYNCEIIPINDDCENATQIMFGETLEAYNELATTSTQAPSCNDVDRADVWFKFSTISDITVDIIVDSGYNLQLWQGSCNSLTQVPGACGADSLNDVPITANTSYYVQVWSSDSGRIGNRATGLFNITLQDGTLSTNDFLLNNISVYPNPVDDILNFNSRVNVEAIKIYNLLGQLVTSSMPNNLNGRIDMSKMASGIYLVKVFSSDFQQTFRVIKQ